MNIIQFSTKFVQSLFRIYRKKIPLFEPGGKNPMRAPTNLFKPIPRTAEFQKFIRQ